MKDKLWPIAFILFAILIGGGSDLATAQNIDSDELIRILLDGGGGTPLMLYALLHK